MLDKQVREALVALREWVLEPSFVQFFKYVSSVNLYRANPHVVCGAHAHQISLFEDYVVGEFSHFAVGAALCLDLPVFRAELDDWQREIFDKLAAGGLVAESHGTFTMGRFQLISAHDMPLLVDSRVNFPRNETHDVYFGVDSALLAYYVDTNRFGQDDLVVDLGTGTSFLALFLSQHSNRVVATDIAPAALELARMNIELNQRGDRIELREEDFESTFAKRERPHAITFNPPFVALPQELSAPVYAKGSDLDGLGWCRKLIEEFDELVAPGGAAYIVADLVGKRPEPFFVEELRQYAVDRKLCIEVFIDSRNDYVEGTRQFEVLGTYLQRENPELSADECRERLEHLHRVELGATCTHLSVMAIRRSTSVAPYCRVFNRYLNLEFGEGLAEAPLHKTGA